MWRATATSKWWFGVRISWRRRDEVLIWEKWPGKMDKCNKSNTLIVLNHYSRGTLPKYTVRLHFDSKDLLLTYHKSVLSLNEFLVYFCIGLNLSQMLWYLNVIFRLLFRNSQAIFTYRYRNNAIQFIHEDHVHQANIWLNQKTGELPNVNEIHVCKIILCHFEVAAMSWTQLGHARFPNYRT